MEIYLVRHTTPDVSKGTCYGQSDLGLSSSFNEESRLVLAQLPTDVDIVYTSPLSRCDELAKLIAGKEIIQAPQLQEMNFGKWEMQLWSSIPQQELDPWMEDFVYQAVPNGESMTQLADRVLDCYDTILSRKAGKIVIVTHAGPIRVILSKMHDTPLKEAFERYQVDYGEVIRLVV